MSIFGYFVNIRTQGTYILSKAPRRLRGFAIGRTLPSPFLPLPKRPRDLISPLPRPHCSKGPSSVRTRTARVLYSPFSLELKPETRSTTVILRPESGKCVHVHLYTHIPPHTHTQTHIRVSTQNKNTNRANIQNTYDLRAGEMSPWVKCLLLNWEDLAWALNKARGILSSQQQRAPARVTAPHPWLSQVAVVTAFQFRPWDPGH